TVEKRPLTSFRFPRAPIARDGLIGHRAPAETACLDAASRTHFHLSLGVIEHTLHLLRDSLRIPGWHQDGRFATHLGKRRRCRGDDRYAASHRFEHGKAETFVKTRKCEKP